MKKVLVTALLLLAVSACSDNEHGTGDAPVGKWNDGPAEVVNFPDGFMNVATKCNHGNRIYAHTREAAPVIVAHDPTCPQEAHG